MSVVKRLSRRLVGQGRITVRDLLLLVGSVDEPEAYLETVFGWSFTRGSEFLKGAFAGWVALAVGAAALLWGQNASTAVVAPVAAVLALALLVFGFVFVNHEMSHLHREWLASAILLRRLIPFKDQIATVVAANAVPDHVTYGIWAGATKRGLRKHLDHEAGEPTPMAKSAGEVGQLLFDALGPVPTVHYEAKQDVRRLTGQVLIKATALATGTESTVARS